MTCSESRYIDELSEAHEIEIVRGAAAELVALGITSAHFVKVLARVVESGDRAGRPLHVRILALDPNDRDGWRYVYHLREGRVVSDQAFEEMLAEDRVMIGRVRKDVDRLNRIRDLRGEIIYYSGIPVVWACVVDDSRITVGNYAMNRLASRLPTSVLVRDDPRTRSMYRYYAAVVEGLATMGGGTAGPRSRTPGAD